jgi:hypothetical protein
MFMVLVSGDSLDLEEAVKVIKEKVKSEHIAFMVVEAAIRDDINVRFELMWCMDTANRVELNDFQPSFRRRFHPYRQDVMNKKNCVDCSALTTGGVLASSSNTVFRHLVDSKGNVFLNRDMYANLDSLSLPSDTRDHLVVSVSRFNLLMEFDTPSTLSVEVELRSPYIVVSVSSFFRFTLTQWTSVIQFLKNQSAYREIHADFRVLLPGNCIEYRLRPINPVFD